MAAAWHARRVNALQGRLGPGVLAHILQYLAMNGAAGRLTVVGDGLGSGSVYLGKGRVTHAEVGNLLGVPAVGQLLAWTRGRFAFQVGVEPSTTTIDLPTDRLLLSLSVAHDDAVSTLGGTGTAPTLDGELRPTPLADPAVVPGLVWAAVVVAGPIGEIFVEEAFDAIGHSPRLLPEDQLGTLVQAVAGQFKSSQGRRDFLARAEAVLAHHGYGRVEGSG